MTHSAVAHTSTITSLTARRRQDLFLAVKEQEALCRAVERIALACQDEGHASLEDVETITLLSRQLGRQLGALANEIASGN